MSDSRRAPGVSILLSVVLAIACERSEPPAARETPDPLFAVADSLRTAGRVRESEVAYRELRDSLASTGDTARYWQAQVGWADAQIRLGRYDTAAAGLDVAMRLAGDDPRREARTRYARSILVDRQGRFDSALVEATRVQELARLAGDLAMEANGYNAIGRNHSLQGRYRQALAANERELALRRESGADDAMIAFVLNDLGISHYRLGRYEDAVRVYERGLALYRTTNRVEGQARILFNYSNVLTEMGEREAARARLTEALHLMEGGDPRGLAFITNGLAQLYLSAGNMVAARPHLLRSLELNRQTGLPYGEIINRVNLAHLLRAEGELLGADRQAAHAMRLADSLGYGRQRASSRISLSSGALARGDRAAALRWADAAVLIADSLGDPTAQYDALEARARALEAVRSPGAAAAYVSAIDLLESWRGRVALGDLRMGISESRLGAYEGAIRVMLEEGRAEDAFHIAERARARLLLELMAERVRTGDGQAAAPRSARQRIEDDLRVNAVARATVTRPEAIAKLDRAFAALIDSLALLTAAERAAVGASVSAALRAPEPASVAQIRSSLLGPRRAVQAYFWGDSSVYGWWIDRSDVRAARLGRADSLAAVVDFLRSTLERPDMGSSWRQSAVTAYTRFMAPLAPSAVDELIIIADGALTYLPFETLLSAAGSEPLGVTHRTSYGPSAATLLALERDRGEGMRWSRAMLAVGDPRSGRRVADGNERTMMRDSTLRALPFAAAEVRAIGELFEDDGADVLIGDRASMARWERLRPARYRFVHFAAHALVSDRDAARTALVLADGWLDLARIRRLPLHAELVTLSACETGLGQRVRGEGVIGLPHAFLAAGARGVVVTLWPIADRPASDFMVSFYERIRYGTPPASALLETRREWAASVGERAHPSQWASFVLIGGLDPITLTGAR